MKSTGLGNLMTRLLMLFFGLILLVPCAYKLYTYCVFRSQAIAVYGIVDKPARGMEMGSKPFVEYKDHELSLNFSGVLRQWHITLLNPIIQTLRNA